MSEVVILKKKWKKQHDMKLTCEDAMLENHLKCNANLQTWTY